MGVDHSLRDFQINRVLDFLDEQLADRNVTIVFGDADDVRVYLYSNQSLRGYEKQGSLYVKDAGQPESWDAKVYKGFADGFTWDRGHYNSLEQRYKETKNDVLVRDERTKLEPTNVEKDIMGITGPYAWICSDALMKRVKSKYAPTGFEFIEPDDVVFCHESAHGLNKRHEGIFESFDGNKDTLKLATGFLKRPDVVSRGGLAPVYREISRELPGVVEEAFAQHISASYLDRYYPQESERIREFLRAHDTDPWHMAAFHIVLNEEQFLQEIQQEIRQRNLAERPE